MEIGMSGLKRALLFHHNRNVLRDCIAHKRPNSVTAPSGPMQMKQGSSIVLTRCYITTAASKFCGFPDSIWNCKVS